MNPDNELAIRSYSGGLLNLNLYFSSWAAFATSFLVMVGSFSQCNEKCEGSGHRCALWKWAVLIFTSFVVMVGAARMFDKWDCDVDSDIQTVNVSVFIDEVEVQVQEIDKDAGCDRTKFAVSLGCISAIIALVWMVVGKFFMKGHMGSMLDKVLVWLLLAFWTFGVAYLTFDEGKAPAQQLGNVYFFTWGSWALLVFMAMTRVQFTKDEVTAEPAKDDKGDAEDGKGEVKSEPAEEAVVETDDAVA